MKILHIDSSILGESSLSRQISAQVVGKLTSANSDTQITYRDLVAEELPHMSGELIGALRSPPDDPSPEVAAGMDMADTLIEELMAADVVVVGAGLYNLTVPTQLKAWIDRVVLAGRTFRYDADGNQVGLAKGKRVILCISRGGFYHEGSPGEEIEHCESLLRALFGFIGVTQIEAVTADGSAIGPEYREKALASVEEQVAALEV